MLLPIFPQHLHGRAMIQTDDTLQHRKQLRRKPRPSFAQDEVVRILNANASGSPQQIQLVELFLQIE